MSWPENKDIPRLLLVARENWSALVLVCSDDYYYKKYVIDTQKKKKKTIPIYKLEHGEEAYERKKAKGRAYYYKHREKMMSQAKSWRENNRKRYREIINDCWRRKHSKKS